MTASSASLTDAFWVGSSRNQAKKITHQQKPTKAEMKKPMRQGATFARAGTALQNRGEATARKMVPRMRGENAPPQRAMSQINPPARARLRSGSQRDWM